ncbi:MAG: alpha/beta hydrolase, partial [Cyanobacteriota bacterium]
SGQRCIAQAHQLTMPILLLYTSRDSVVNPAGALEFAHHVPHVQVQNFPNSRHDLLHDCQAEAVKQTLRWWLTQHFPVQP